ncbi:hypothetical protein TNCV_2478281 [Trichonephila clavipes]|uniref:Transposase Tc1-like domain-containing protein n=1 Tax=Trichonephila clavipes TaxID=2585209 RepID=A0A8X6R7H5_TRICX|nr:hypothetical protein TNCV_2478281 [Trichonephila clavipes]
MPLTEQGTGGWRYATDKDGNAFYPTNHNGKEIVYGKYIYKRDGYVKYPLNPDGHPQYEADKITRTRFNSPSKQNSENATQLQRQLPLATGRKMSSQTVRNRLHEGGLYARRPMVCIPLTPRHRAARRRWAAEHRD